MCSNFGFGLQERGILDAKQVSRCMSRDPLHVMVRHGPCRQNALYQRLARPHPPRLQLSTSVQELNAHLRYAFKMTVS